MVACGTLKQTDAARVEHRINATHEVCLDSIWLIWESSEVTAWDADAHVRACVITSTGGPSYYIDVSLHTPGFASGALAVGPPITCTFSLPLGIMLRP